MSAGRNPSHTMSELDGIRAFAILAVLALHGGYGWVPGGFLGVDLFFVLSGFLITLLLCKEIGRNGEISYWRFYARRALRILPPLAVGLGLAWSLGGFDPATGAQPILLFYANLVDHLKLGTMTHTWSLAVEEQFYLIWPLAFGFAWRLGGRTAAAGVALVVFAASLGLRIYFYREGMDLDVLYRHPLARSDSLAAGCLMALMAGDRRLVLPGLYTIGLAVIAGLAATITPRTHWAMVTAGHSAFAALFAVLIGAAAAAPATDVCKRLLSHPVLVWIGRRSYGIYVYHVPIFVALEAFRVKGSLVNLVLVTLARLLLTLAVAEASYRLIEQPLLRLKRFFYPAQRSTETPPRAEPPRSAREPLAPAPIAPAQPV